MLPLVFSALLSVGGATPPGTTTTGPGDPADDTAGVVPDVDVAERARAAALAAVAAAVGGSVGAALGVAAGAALVDVDPAAASLPSLVLAPLGAGAVAFATVALLHDGAAGFAVGAAAATGAAGAVVVASGSGGVGADGTRLASFVVVPAAAGAVGAALVAPWVAAPSPTGTGKRVPVGVIR